MRNLITSIPNLFIAIAALVITNSAHAAGMGKLSVQSALGEPLKAEIELLSVSKDELSTITARLAGADAFRQARIERPSILHSLQFSVTQRNNGQPIIRITSAEPIEMPHAFLDFLIEINWGNGRVLREYTILIDPPTVPNMPHTSSATNTTKTAIRPIARTAVPSINKSPPRLTPPQVPSPRPPTSATQPPLPRTLAQWRQWIRSKR